MLAVSAGASVPAQARKMAYEPVAVSQPVISRPQDLILAPDGRHLLVADLDHHRVRVMDADTLAVVGEIGAGQLPAPRDVALDDRGRLMVADTGNNRVAIFALSGVTGRLVDKLTRGLGRPEGVVQGPDARVLVKSVPGSHITAFENGRGFARAGGPGSGPNQYLRPQDIDEDPAGRVIVADPGNNRLQVLSLDLKFRLGIGGAPLHEFNEPGYVALDEAGRLYAGGISATTGCWCLTAIPHSRGRKERAPRAVRRISSTAWRMSWRAEMTSGLPIVTTTRWCATGERAATEV